MVVVLDKVRHGYAASKSPLKPRMIIRTNGTVEVAHCTCMAGLPETCSHIGAIFHWVETAVRICNNAPGTSLENKWLIPESRAFLAYISRTLTSVPLNISQLCHDLHAFLALPERLKLHSQVKLKNFPI